MADTTVYAATDNTTGFAKNLVREETASTLEVQNGAGVIKSLNQWGNKFRVSGTYVWQAADAAFEAHVGDGTAVTVADTDIGNGATLYLESVTYRKGGGESMAAMEIDFVGWEYPSLTV